MKFEVLSYHLGNASGVVLAIKNVRYKNLENNIMIMYFEFLFEFQTETFGLTKIAINNIAEKCITRPKEMENLDFLQKLELIRVAILNILINIFIKITTSAQ